jgi:enterochelin esterase-like enzyme
MKVLRSPLLVFSTLLTPLLGIAIAPTVHDNGRVTIQIDAPEAKRVQIDIKGRTHDENNQQPFDMIRSKDGQWSFTSSPLDPGFHYYFLFIDGYRFADSSNPLYFGWGRPTNGVEIPDPKLEFVYTPRQVPRGELRTRSYYSKITESWRDAIIYTPPQYHTSNRNYPVLYLQHGAGENQTSWSNQGRIGIIMDNLLAEKKCEPMIIVMENGYAYPPNAKTDEEGRTINHFETLLIEETIPMVEMYYRVKTDKKYRAIAGLSMGGGQALRIGLGNLDKFSYLGCFSGAARDAGSLIKTGETVNEALELFWIACGTEDFVYERSQTLIKELNAVGVKHDTFWHPGTHEWQSWRLQISRFAPQLFRD